MRKICGLMLLIFVLFGAKCEKSQNDIPYHPVDITININQPSYFNLTAISGHETIVGGSMGIIVYRNSFDEFTALERHVPFNVGENCRVEILDDLVTLEDPCSGSQWLIMDGSLIKGPASQPLLQYNTSFNDPILRIYN